LRSPGITSLEDRLRFTLLITDRDDGFRDLLKRHLGKAVLVVAEASDDDDAVALARQLRPDVVLLDVAMPPLGGPEAARRIKADHAETKVVLLTDERDHASRTTGGSGANDPSLHADAVVPMRTCEMPFHYTRDARGGRPRR
jgi:CheY-like chemotaxis protein